MSGVYLLTAVPVSVSIPDLIVSADPDPGRPNCP
jgi:hypothetical protein